MIRFACLLLAVFSFGWAAQPVVDFLHISDTHVVDLREAHPGIVKARGQHAKNGETLARFLQDVVARLRPSFLVHTGDISDAYCLERPTKGRVCPGVERARPILALSSVPVYLALGNHDIEIYRYSDREQKINTNYSVAGRARKEWARAAASFRNGTYYSFEQQAGRTRYRFLVLDNGERKTAKKSKFSAAQMAWLRKEAAGPDAALILVLHVPLGEDECSAEIKEALSGSDRVVLALAGHNHSSGIREIPLGNRRVTQVRTGALAVSANNWRRFRLRENGIEIGAVGDADSTDRTIPLPAAAPGR
jgi:3',5'-cyclic AMP phosphodiesterase CpdA